MSRTPDIERKNIYNQLENLVLSGRVMGVTQRQLAERFNTSLPTINKYIKQIYESTPPEDLNHTRVKLQSLFDLMFREAQNLLIKAETPKEKADALDLLMRCINKFQDFLERFFIKPKEVSIMQGIDDKLSVEVIYGTTPQVKNEDTDN